MTEEKIEFTIKECVYVYMDMDNKRRTRDLIKIKENIHILNSKIILKNFYLN